MSDPYTTPNSNLGVKSQNNLIASWAKGDIALWKAIIFIQIIGWVIIVAITTLFAVVMPLYIYQILTIAISAPYILFSSFVVWNSSPNPKISVKGALAKLWCVIFAVYSFAVIFRVVFLVPPQT